MSDRWTDRWTYKVDKSSTHTLFINSVIRTIAIYIKQSLSVKCSSVLSWFGLIILYKKIWKKLQNLCHDENTLYEKWIMATICSHWWFLKMASQLFDRIIISDSTNCDLLVIAELFFVTPVNFWCHRQFDCHSDILSLPNLSNLYAFNLTIFPFSSYFFFYNFYF